MQYNSNTFNKLTVVNDRVRPFSKSKTQYTEEARIQIYAITGIISCMLLVILFASSVVVIQKRKHRERRILTDSNSVARNQLNISGPSEPWTTNEKLREAFPNMIRSNVWFDSLQKSIQRHDAFINPMISLFPNTAAEEEEEIQDQAADSHARRARRKLSFDSSWGDVHFQSKPTTMTDGSSLGSIQLDDDNESPDYENYPKHKRADTNTSLKRSKSIAHIEKPLRY